MIINFRGWNTNEEQMYDMEDLEEDWESHDGYYDSFFRQDHWISMLSTQIEDINGKEIFEYDIGEFPNGDRFVVRSEEWIAFYVDWIGDPNMEDQARDFERISRSKIIGNMYENPEMVKELV